MILQLPTTPAFRRLNVFVVLALALIGLALLAGHARAQTKPPPPPAVLTAVSVANAGPGETRLILTFAPLAPKFSIIKNGTEQPAIAFALSSRGEGAHTPPDLHGMVRSIAFEQHDTILILTLNAAGPAQITATPVGDQVISLSITPPSGEKKQAEDASAAAPHGPLPKAVEPAAGEDGFEVVPLKYADVSEVVGLLTQGLTVKSNDVFVPHEPAFGSAGMNGGAVAAAPPPGPDVTQDPMGQSVDEAIGIDRRLNAIVLRGSRQRIARLKAEIAEIDVPVESVWLETIVVELTEQGAKNVGIDFTNANGQIGVATFQTGAYLPPGSASLNRGLGSLSLQAAIYDQVTKGRGRIVSKPRISAQSGSSAKIITGDALPILTSITLSGVNGVSQQVQYVNVGVTLQIAPRVSLDGYVTSHVFCEVSSVTGYSQGYPTISQREASTSATVRDGETFVIGGLTQENQISSKGKIPILGDVPLAGALFKLDRTTSSNTELYIVVTPHIVRRGEPTPAAAAAGPP